MCWTNKGNFCVHVTTVRFVLASSVSYTGRVKMTIEGSSRDKNEKKVDVDFNHYFHYFGK